MLAAVQSESLVGHTEPRLFTVPARDLTPETSLGFEAIDFVETVIGDKLLPWQRWLFEHALELDLNGRFRFRTLLVLVGRQSGKSTWAKYLALWRMYADDAKLVLGTAQNLDVAESLWKQAVETAEGCSALRKQITQVEMSSGRKTLHLKGGRAYKVQSSNRRGARGMSGDLVLLDELREHQTWDAWSAVSKTTMARPRSQLVCLSNAGDDNSIVLNDLRERALVSVDDPTSTVGIFEWSATEDCDISSPANWAMASPALGYTVEESSIASALATDPEWVFRTEVLCQRVSLAAVSPLPTWPSVRDPHASISPGLPVGFAVDVSWDRSRAWIAAAARLPDDRAHLEAVATETGTDWVVPRLRELCDKWDPVAVAVQASGAPASTLLGELEEYLEVPVLAVGGADLARSCGLLYDGVAAGRIRHPGQELIDTAARHAAIRPLSDAWVFDRKRSPVDIAGLMAEALALWALTSAKPKPKRTAPRRLR